MRFVQVNAPGSQAASFVAAAPADCLACVTLLVRRGSLHPDCGRFGPHSPVGLVDRYSQSSRKGGTSGIRPAERDEQPARGVPALPVGAGRCGAAGEEETVGDHGEAEEEVEPGCPEGQAPAPGPHPPCPGGCVQSGGRPRCAQRVASLARDGQSQDARARTAGNCTCQWSRSSRLRTGSKLKPISTTAEGRMDCGDLAARLGSDVRPGGLRSRRSQARVR